MLIFEKKLDPAYRIFFKIFNFQIRSGHFSVQTAASSKSFHEFSLKPGSLHNFQVGLAGHVWSGLIYT